MGSPPGDGYDLYARLLAPHLARKLNATVLVENRDGNGGLAALAALVVRPEDGLTIMHASAEAAILSRMLERPGVAWDVTALHGWPRHRQRQSFGSWAPTRGMPRSRMSPRPSR